MPHRGGRRLLPHLFARAPAGCRLQRRPAEEGAEEKKQRTGLCGATAETIVARNFARMVCSGAASHNDHSRGVAKLFKEVALGKAQGYQIKDVAKLKRLARDWGVATTEGEGEDVKPRSKEDIALEMADKILLEFGQQDGELTNIQRAPKKRQELWRKLGVVPRGIDREIVEIMHRTHMGVDQDYHNLLTQGRRTALADGWGGSMIATDLQDIMFGTPVPVAGEINLGVLKEDEVNIIIHGHEPLLSEMIWCGLPGPGDDRLCQEQGGQGHQPGRHVLHRQRDTDAPRHAHRRQLPAAGAGHRHRRAGSDGGGRAVHHAGRWPTWPSATTPRSSPPTRGPRSKRATLHIEFDEHHALDIGQPGRPRRPSTTSPTAGQKVHDPRREDADLIAGFSHETINYLLGGLFRASYRPLNDNIINGRIRGVAGVVGCNNARATHDSVHVTLVKELIKNDVLVLADRLLRHGRAKAGLMLPEAAEVAGPGWLRSARRWASRRCCTWAPAWTTPAS